MLFSSTAQTVSESAKRPLHYATASQQHAQKRASVHVDPGLGEEFEQVKKKVKGTLITNADAAAKGATLPAKAAPATAKAAGKLSLAAVAPAPPTPVIAPPAKGASSIGDSAVALALVADLKTTLKQFKDAKDDSIQEEGQRFSYLEEVKEGFQESLTKQGGISLQLESAISRVEDSCTAMRNFNEDRILFLENALEQRTNENAALSIQINAMKLALEAANARAYAAIRRHLLIPDTSGTQITGNMLAGGFDTFYRVNWTYDRKVIAVGPDLELFNTAQ